MGRTVVIGHRGAPGHAPDHTLEGYRLAVHLGADAIEPDLVSTKDHVLVARHENELSMTTDVADRFPERRTTRTIDGKAVTGWFTEDFTLAELRLLRARQPMADRSRQLDGLLPVPTLEEILDLLPELSASAGRPIGIEPETKHPSYFRSIGLPLEEPLLAALGRRGLLDGRDGVWIQSFEEENLRALRASTPLRLLRLVDPSEPHHLSAEGLRAIAGHAHGVGAPKRLLVDDEGRDTGAVERIRAAGLQVHVWTFRDEARFVSPWAGGDPKAELRRFFSLGVDAVFADHPDTAAAARA